MSKIQKALNALRNSQQGRKAQEVENADVALLPPRTETSNQIRRRPQSPNNVATVQGRKVPFDSSGETTPLHNIEIHANDLVKAGLCPGKNDLEIISQQFRRIKRPIIQAAFETDLPTGENANVIMMASALPGAGKTFCAVNLARSITRERDTSAVLVDADVLKPGISRSFGLQDHLGLIDYLVDPSIELQDILIQTNLNGIVVIPAGRKHPEATELLASHRMQELVSRLSRQYKSRIVIFDMPPLLITSEAQVLAAQAGQIVIVIEARVSSQESLMRALGMLDRTKPINAILNKSRSAAGSGYHNDDYGYYPYPSTNNKIGYDE